MKLFVDTNIVVELFENRREADLVERIFAVCERNNWQRFISVGSFYTLTYLTERILRRQGMQQPDLNIRLRQILDDILNAFDISPISKSQLRQGVDSSAFSDLEDSYQHQSAIAAQCDVLLTINKKDFQKAQGITVLTPQEFVERL